jgi:hypothetical protein
MDARIRARDVQGATYADAIGEEAHEADYQTDRPVNVRRDDASQRDRNRYKDESPEPCRTKSIFWDPYAFALFLCPSHHHIRETPRNRGSDWTCE